jgi:hypothetical protein
VKDALSGAERTLFAAAPPAAAGVAIKDAAGGATAAPATCVVEERELPRALVDAANAALPAAEEAAALVGAAAGAPAPTIASTAVWARLTAALTAHDWHAAREAKHVVEQAQRVRCAPVLCSCARRRHPGTDLLRSCQRPGGA